VLVAFLAPNGYTTRAFYATDTLAQALLVGVVVAMTLWKAGGGRRWFTRLAPELAALGHAHANASPGGGWPGPLPPSTPSWFSNLPCQ
jgi:hypothetical protein